MPVTSYAELEIGGYAVHVDQGIGVYRGLVSREVLGVKREYLLIEYAGGDRLYVPTTHLSKVQRYVGAENPAVHRLRGREWFKSRKKARRSAEKMARELLELYLERKTRGGLLSRLTLHGRGSSRIRSGTRTRRTRDTLSKR